MSTSATPAPKPCPHCGVIPIISSEPTIPITWYVACSNELDCPVWPMTFLLSTPADAIAAWNAGNTH